MDDFSDLTRKPPDSPTSSQVLRNDGIDSSPLLPLTDDPQPPLFGHPPEAIESNAALIGNQLIERDSFVDESVLLGNPEEKSVERQKSEPDAAKLKERGACLDADELVEGPTVCDDHHVEQNNADQLPLPALPADCDSCQLLRQIIHCSGMD